MKMNIYSWTSGSTTGALFDSGRKGSQQDGTLNGQALQKTQGKCKKPLFGLSVLSYCRSLAVPQVFLHPPQTKQINPLLPKDTQTKMRFLVC